MKTSLQEYRAHALEGMLTFLWRQWSALGVAGYAGEDSPWVADPEALLAFSCTITRYDARLFDEILDWLAVNGRFVNSQRLRNVVRDGAFHGSSVLAAITSALCNHVPTAKWRFNFEAEDRSGNAKPLFLGAHGRPLPLGKKCDPDFEAGGFLRAPFQLRKHALPFPLQGRAATLLRLRALVGLNARSEILLYLLCNSVGHPHEIARQTHYFQKTVHDVLADMSCSGFLVSTKRGREREYRLASPQLSVALQGSADAPPWINWPSLLSAIEMFWIGLDALLLEESSNQAEAAALYLLSSSFVDAVHAEPGFPAFKKPAPNGTADAYIEPFLTILNQLASTEPLAFVSR